MSGYSLHQLLSWCVADQLIDGFAVTADSVLLLKDQHGVRLSATEAQEYLITLIRQQVGIRESRRRNSA
jgi:hypothetical protein